MLASSRGWFTTRTSRLSPIAGAPVVGGSAGGYARSAGGYAPRQPASRRPVRSGPPVRAVGARGYDAPMGLLRNATCVLCLLVVVAVAIGVLGISKSRRGGGK
jgi:hypothetical protein